MITQFMDRHRENLGHTATELAELEQALADCEAWLPEEPRPHVRAGAKVRLAHVRDALVTLRATLN